MNTQRPAKYLVLIEDGEGMVARLFDAERQHLGDFDGSTFEVADMTVGVVPTQGIDRKAWGHALDGHNEAARAAALVYELNP